MDSALGVPAAMILAGWCAPTRPGARTDYFPPGMDQFHTTHRGRQLKINSRE